MEIQKHKNSYSVLIPIVGIILFAILYIIATLYYPGGSQIDKNSIGFSWQDNYWCNLLNDRAINGTINTAQPIALAAMGILCFSLIIFWNQFPKYTTLSNIWKSTIKIFGTGSMIIAFFLYTKYDHDLITNFASLLGLVAVFITFFALFRSRWLLLFYFGLFNTLLVLLNNFFYYNKELIYLLPVIQKVSFASVLIWISLICIKMFNYKPIQSKNGNYN